MLLMAPLRTALMPFALADIARQVGSEPFIGRAPHKLQRSRTRSWGNTFR